MSQNQACLALRPANLAAFPAPRPWLRSVVGVVVCCGFPCWGTASVQAQSRSGAASDIGGAPNSERMPEKAGPSLKNHKRNNTVIDEAGVLRHRCLCRAVSRIRGD